jgi:hypothetical protein
MKIKNPDFFAVNLRVNANADKVAGKIKKRLLVRKFVL